MYVISRNMKVAKDLTDSVVEEFSTPSAVTKAEGFIRRELLVNRKAEDADVIKVLIYWKDEDAQKKWHASKEHQQGHIDRHKQRKETGKEPLNRKALNMTMEDFDVVSTLEAQ